MRKIQQKALIQLIRWSYKRGTFMNIDYIFADYNFYRSCIFILESRFLEDASHLQSVQIWDDHLENKEQKKILNVLHSVLLNPFINKHKPAWFWWSMWFSPSFNSVTRKSERS